MISETLRKAIAKATGVTEQDVVLEHPADLSHGDYSSSIALSLAKEHRKAPEDLAREIIHELEKENLPAVEKMEVAGPGFINFHLSRTFFADSVTDVRRSGDRWGVGERLSKQKVMVEYTDPNPFKEFHIGHLMSNAIGESISRLLEYAGAEVKRANYQGDVGVHVAKAVWAKQQKPELSWGEAYAYGAANYETNKDAIDEVNKKLYERSDETLNALYDSGRKDSLEHFEEMYKLLGTSFDYYFFESDAAPIGKALVEGHKDVFEESDGAVIFRAETYDPSLHTRVFITSQGIPTYEAKELGLAKLKFDTWAHDRSVVITAHEIEAYYRVVLAALERIAPTLAAKIMHKPHGMLRLPSGKMSSRTGDVIAARTLIDEVRERALEKMEEKDEKTAEHIAVGAIKYSILKQAAGRDIVFDMEKSLSFEGDSGPYLQYSHARACSVLEKANHENVRPKTDLVPKKVTELERLLYRFPEVVGRAEREYEPHHIATFLIEIAGAFNSWYAKEKIVEESADAPYKVALTDAFAMTMKNGLWLLGIQAPERM